MTEEIRFSQPSDPEKWTGLETAIVQLRPKRGDVWLVNVQMVDIQELSHTPNENPEINFPIQLIPVYPTPNGTIEESIRTCGLADLKRIVAEMEAESST